jgi:creatinine deaminase
MLLTALTDQDRVFLDAALEEAKRGFEEGGIPIGSVVVIDGRIVGRGHNRRIQRASAILHAEMDCLENAGRLQPEEYRRAILYSTLSPCDMCSGAILLYKIPEVVVGETQTFVGPEEHLRSRGVQIRIAQEPRCIRLLQDFIRLRPEAWNEDIGEIGNKTTKK